MRYAVVIAFVLPACTFQPNTSSISGDGAQATDSPVQHDAPAGSDAAIARDASLPTDAEAIDAPPPTCLAVWEMGTAPTFTPPVLLLGSGSDHDDRDPALVPDGNTIVFSRGESSGSSTLFEVALDGTGSAASAELKMSAATSHLDPHNPSKVTFVSTTELILSAALATNTIELGDSTLGGGQFGTPSTTTVAKPDAFGSPLYDPALYGSGLDLYFSADQSSQQSIWLAQRDSVTSDFGSATQVISSDGGNADPTLTTDQLVIVFTSTRATSQSSDLWYATRADTTSPFGTANRLAGLDTPQADGDALLSADACTLWFASTRSGPYELYVTHVVLPQH